MSTILPSPTNASSNSGLKITLVVFGAFGMTVWGTSIGFILGWDHGNILFFAGVAAYVSVIANAAIIYVTCRIMFLVMHPSFPSGETLQDLHQCVARLVAFTVLGFTTWVDSVVWIAQLPDDEKAIVYHACNYGFVISAIVAGLAGGLLRITSNRTALPVTVGAPKYASQQGHYPQQSYQGSHAQYTNPAYGHHYHQQRM